MNVISRLLIISCMSSIGFMAFNTIVGPIGREFGWPDWQVGLILTVAGLCWMLSSQAWGRLSDRRGRKHVLMLGVGGYAVMYTALSLTTHYGLALGTGALLFYLVILLERAALGGLYAAVPAASQAYVADVTTEAERARGMAALGIGSAIGMVIGPALAGLLATTSLVAPLYVATAMGVVSLGIVRFQLPAGPAADSAARNDNRLKLSDPRLRPAMLVALNAMSTVMMVQVTLGFFVQDRFALDVKQSAQTAGVVMTTVGIGLIIAQMGVRRLGWTPQRLIRIGSWLGAAGFGAAAFATSTPVLMATSFLASIGMGFVFPSFQALASLAVEPDEQGSAAGAVAAAQASGLVIIPLVATSLYALHPQAPYLFAALLAVIQAVMIRPHH